MEKLYSCKQVAERYGVKVETVWTWIRDKRLPAVKIGGLYRIREQDLIDFECETRFPYSDMENNEGGKHERTTNF